MPLIALLVAAIAGLFMAVQGSFNTALSKAIGLIEATLVVQVIGAIITAVLLVAGIRSGSFSQFREAPWYSYMGGLLGAAIVYAVVRAISQVGVAAATTAIIVGQVATAALIDQCGLFGLQQHAFTWLNGVGLLLLAAGAFLLLK